MKEPEKRADLTYQAHNESNIEGCVTHENVNLVVNSSSYWNGPLPSAVEFAEYERVSPGAAKELLDMAKDEMEHRHKCDIERLRLEEKKIDKENNEVMASARAGAAVVQVAAHGQISSVFILACLIAAVCFCAKFGPRWTAGGLFVVLIIFSLVILSGSANAVTDKRNPPDGSADKRR